MYFCALQKKAMHRKQILIFIFCLLCSRALWAVMAYPYPIEIDLPDGSKLEIQRHGDEFFNYTTDRSGYIIAQKPDGYYYYANYDEQAKLNISNYRAGSRAARRSAVVPEVNFRRAAQIRSERYEASRDLIRANAKQAYEGRLKTLVLLVAFQDKAFVSPTAHDDFNRLSNELGYSDNGATGSVRDYYRDNSNGVFDPEFVVMGPYTLSKPMSYYGGNNEEGNDNDPRRMVIEAAWMANEEGVDFSEFDQNNDGYVDFIYVYYAGYNEAEGGPAASIWPHSWSVAYMDSTLLDGVKLGYYACSSELAGASGSTMSAIGTVCHEYGHTLGLMDVYDTDGAESGGMSGGLGALSLMSSGNYNNKSRTPPHLTSEERWSLGWMTPTTITEAGDYSLASIDQNQAYIIPTLNENEYFLLENRQHNNWDLYIKGEGLLIYHVDKSKNMVLGKTALERWYTNTVNVYPQHQCMDMEEAVGSESKGDMYAFYPGPSGLYTAFTRTTTPAALAWSGLPLGKELYDIRLEGQEIHFRVELEDQVYFGGQVINREGQPVQGALLYLKELVEQPVSGNTTGLRSAMHTSGVYYTTTSGIDGRFIFDEDLDPGVYELLCQSEAYISNSQIVELKPGSNSVLITLLTEAEQLIEGTLSWCRDFSYGGAIGNEGESFVAGASWTAEELSQYRGMYIGRMIFFIAGGSPDVEVSIYADRNPIFKKNIAAEDLTANSFYSLNLMADSLVINPETELILAYQVSNYPKNAYPAGICGGSRVEGKGNLISLDQGATWTTLYQEEEIEGNWLISFDIYRGSDFVAMESFNLDPTDLTMKIGETRYLYGQIKPANATNGKISWSSSDSSVVWVDQTGKVFALAAGQTVVTATTDGGNRSATCQVKVVPTIASSLNVNVAQHVFYVDWDEVTGDAWTFSWRNLGDSIYQDTTLTQSSFLLEGLDPKSTTEVLVQSYSEQQLVDEHAFSVTTANKKSDFMAIYTTETFSPGQKLLLDVLNLPEDASVNVWKLNDEVISGSILELSEGIHELRAEITTSKGIEIIRRQLKVE